jgi:hypothetical protein
MSLLYLLLGGSGPEPVTVGLPEETASSA